MMPLREHKRLSSDLIPDTTKLHQLEENNGAVEVDLGPEDLGGIADVLAKVTVRGDRYPAHLRQRVGC